MKKVKRQATDWAKNIWKSTSVSSTDTRKQLSKLNSKQIIQFNSSGKGEYFQKVVPNQLHIHMGEERKLTVIFYQVQKLTQNAS